MIGVLTGLMKPTSGTAEMYNYDISEDMDSIRQFMGICPQFDILWDELTAQEHLQLFAKLKGSIFFHIIKLNFSIKEFLRIRSQQKLTRDYVMLT